MRVAVALAVPEPLGPGVVGIAQVSGHGRGLTGPHIGQRLVERHSDRVGLRSGGHGERGLGQDEPGLRHPDHGDRLLGGNGGGQHCGVGEAHVLGGVNDDAAGDVAGVLPGGDHARQVVHRGVGVRAAHRLDESADDVVMLVSGAVVTHRRHVSGPLDVGDLDERRRTGSRCLRQDRAGGGLQHRERLAGVGAGHAHDLLASLLTDAHGAGQAPLVIQRAINHAPDVIGPQRLERQEQGAGQQR